MLAKTPQFLIVLLCSASFALYAGEPQQNQNNKEQTSQNQKNHSEKPANSIKQSTPSNKSKTEKPQLNDMGFDTRPVNH